MRITNITFDFFYLIYHRIEIAIFPGVKLVYYNIARLHTTYKDMFCFSQTARYAYDDYESHDITVKKTSGFFYTY